MPSSTTISATVLAVMAITVLVVLMVLLIINLGRPKISYPTTTLALTNGVAMTTDTPTYNNFTPTNWVISPSLPTGLSINSSTGAISGTPGTTSAQTTYTITATDASAHHASAQVTITIT